MTTATDVWALREGRAEQALPLRWLSQTWWFLRRKPLGAIGAVLVVVVLLLALLAPWIAPYDYGQQSLREKFQGPSRAHIMGTDELGRDIFTRIVYGARVSIIIGVTVVAISVTLAVALGLITGYFGGWIDTLSQRGVDIWIAFPDLILLITIIAVFGVGLPQLILALAISRFAGSSRLHRGLVLSLKQNQFVEAARAMGASDRRIMFRHLLPNLVPIILVSASIGLGGAILAESSLSFLGLGVPPPFPTWGGMLSRGRSYIAIAPHMVVWPFVALAVTVFAFNVLGDALRDVLDPRLRGSR
ncbi:MAG: ABC transporter permease [Dehalococcoidia bacterium]